MVWGKVCKKLFGRNQKGAGLLSLFFIQTVDCYRYLKVESGT